MSSRTPTKFHYIIEENYGNSDLTAFADTLGYDLHWLSRTIKNITGKTYTQLLQEKRLRQATHLLNTTSLSVTDINLHVGYNNFTYFYNLFKKQYGMSPKKFRKTYE